MSQSTTPLDPIGRRDGLREAVRLAERRVALADERVEAARAAKHAAANEALIARDNLRKCREELDKAEGDAIACIPSAELRIHDDAGTTRSTTVELIIDGIPFALVFDRNSNRGEVRIEAGQVTQIFSSSSLATAEKA